MGAGPTKPKLWTYCVARETDAHWKIVLGSQNRGDVQTDNRPEFSPRFADGF